MYGDGWNFSCDLYTVCTCVHVIHNYQGWNAGVASPPPPPPPPPPQLYNLLVEVSGMHDHIHLSSIRPFCSCRCHGFLISINAHLSSPSIVGSHRSSTLRRRKEIDREGSRRDQKGREGSRRGKESYMYHAYRYF